MALEVSEAEVQGRPRVLLAVERARVAHHEAPWLLAGADPETLEVDWHASRCSSPYFVDQNVVSISDFSLQTISAEGTTLGLWLFDAWLDSVTVEGQVLVGKAVILPPNRMQWEVEMELQFVFDPRVGVVSERWDKRRAPRRTVWFPDLKALRMRDVDVIVSRRLAYATNGRGEVLWQRAVLDLVSAYDNLYELPADGGLPRRIDPASGETLAVLQELTLGAQGPAPDPEP